ncbi:MAG TPA: hypothetical protein PKA88_21695, partial [Polyangiaceae bacterium]|nr:hypothetical protein [Polyangiaceae bacterium]
MLTLLFARSRAALRLFIVAVLTLSFAPLVQAQQPAAQPKAEASADSSAPVDVQPSIRLPPSEAERARGLPIARIDVGG